MKYFFLIYSLHIICSNASQACPMGEDGYYGSYSNSSNSDSQEKRVGCLAVTQEYFKNVKAEQEKKKQEEQAAKSAQQMKKKE